MYYRASFDPSPEFNRSMRECFDALAELGRLAEAYDWQTYPEANVVTGAGVARSLGVQCYYTVHGLGLVLCAAAMERRGSKRWRWLPAAAFLVLNDDETGKMLVVSTRMIPNDAITALVKSPHVALAWLKADHGTPENN